MPPKDLWKLTIKPRKGLDAFSLCKAHSLIGVGWSLGSIPSDENHATKLFRSSYKKGYTGFNALVNRMKVGNHAWVFGRKKYYICVITSKHIYKIW